MVFHPPRGFFERLAGSAEARDPAEEGICRARKPLGRALEGHQSMVFTRVRAHAHMSRKLFGGAFADEFGGGAVCVVIRKTYIRIALS